jgi:hypothetical protein
MRTDPTPDFFLKSSEGSTLDGIRACWVKGPLVGQARPDSFWIEVDPPVRANKLGIGGPDLKNVVVATRHVGASLHPINESPVYVYVCRALRDEIFGEGKFTAKDVEQIAWGEAYAMYSDASQK